MHKLALSLCLLAGLAGCASAPAPASYGSFVKTPNAADEKTMADDAVKRLTALYPPARTRFNLQHATPDSFGGNLVTELRAKGYALAEVKPGAQPVTPTAGEQSLAYVIDQPLDPGMYRVTIFINSQSLSRVYQPVSGELKAAGPWLRKE